MTASKLPPRHSAKELVNHRLRRFFYSALAAVLFVTSFGAMAWHDLQSSVNQIDPNQFLIGNRSNRPVTDYDGRAVNILVMGTDSRQGANNIDGGAATESSARSDTTMIMHISADRKRIQVVSIPRDTMVDIPECKSADGTITDSMYAQFNTAFANGAGSGDLSARALAAGAACAISTVEKLTDIHIDDYMVVDFAGLKNMVDALDGVGVYVSEDIDDPEYTQLKLDKGCHHLDGSAAVMYARVRHGVSDGSDLHRIERQQNLMGAMMRTAMRKNLLTSAPDLYAFAKAALGTLTTSPHVGQLNTLAGLAMSVRTIGFGGIEFITAPNEADPDDPNRVVLREKDAKALWKSLKDDKPAPTNTISSTANGTPAPAATATATETEDPAQGTEPSSEETTQAPAPKASSPAPAPKASASPTTDPALQCK